MPLPPIPPVETPRLTLRELRPADLPDLMAVNGHPQATRYLPYPTWAGDTDAQAWLQRMQALAATGTGRQFVLARRSDGKVLGTLLLFKHDEGSARAEIGYVLGPDHWRQGLMEEALRHFCRHLFTHAGLRRLEAEVNPDNEASNALLLKLGFVLEGRLRQRWVAKGQAYDTNVYGALGDEWRGADAGLTQDRSQAAQI